ncbi:MAG: hypothetical protein GC204_03350 [Chloroflexi bacterium]|nr:hypothetical protein [Chloroflexota bacterium]
MMHDPARVALLWIIRTYQPISADEISALLQKSPPELSRVTVTLASTTYIDQDPKFALQDLFDAGLIETEDGQPWTRSSRLVVSGRYQVLKRLFDISLTDMVKHPRDFVRAYPLFEKPLDTSSEAWARIFVAMPFDKNFPPIYADHILKVTRELNLTCKRGDDFFHTTAIMKDVWSAIYHADLCIVDCSGTNPNVFYELGIAHTLGRPTILITQKLDDIPFDIRHLRVIIYQYTPPGMGQFEEILRQTIQAELRL